jgi:inner membrane protein
MDPVSHVACGRLLIQPVGHRIGRGAIAASILGSLAPDVDLLFAPRGWDVYLRLHQGGTHSLPGAMLCGIAAGALVAIVTRRAPGRLALAGLLGAVAHVALDLIAGADIRPLWPFVPARISLPLFAMADPWLLAGLVLAALLVSLNAGRFWVRLSVSLLTALLVVKSGLYVAATRIDEKVDHVSATRFEAVWGSLTRWMRYRAQPETVEATAINVRDGTAAPIARFARNLGDPLAVQSRSLATVDNLLASHDITFALVRSRVDRGSDVFWSDLRYCTPAARQRPVDEASDLVCGLWFGGEYDERARARAAVMEVGPIVQRRPVATLDPPKQ